jgi:hypothetical protein
MGRHAPGPWPVQGLVRLPFADQIEDWCVLRRAAQSDAFARLRFPLQLAARAVEHAVQRLPDRRFLRLGLAAQRAGLSLPPPDRPGRREGGPPGTALPPGRARSQNPLVEAKGRRASPAFCRSSACLVEPGISACDGGRTSRQADLAEPVFHHVEGHARCVLRDPRITRDVRTLATFGAAVSDRSESSGRSRGRARRISG